MGNRVYSTQYFSNISAKTLLLTASPPVDRGVGISRKPEVREAPENSQDIYLPQQYRCLFYRKSNV